MILEPFLVDDSILGKEKIEWDFKWPHSNRSRGGIKDEVRTPPALTGVSQESGGRN